MIYSSADVGKIFQTNPVYSKSSQHRPKGWTDTTLGYIREAKQWAMTERVLNLDPKTGKRAIEKANTRIAELEDQMMTVEKNLTNWSGRYQEIRDEMFAHVYALRAATEALDDPDADNRRKARAIRLCIQKVNLTFKPTGKKYPTSELVEIEIIPAEPEYPNGASG